MHREIPELKEHTAINHLSLLRNASNKNSPPESSSTQITHVSQESQGKSGITERGVMVVMGAGGGLLSFEHAEAKIPQLKQAFACGRNVTVNGHDAPCACKFVCRVPIFKGSSYPCTECIMHRMSSPVCNQQCLHATRARIQVSATTAQCKALDNTPFNCNHVFFLRAFHRESEGMRRR